jgi:uncharacterized membrane protein YhhN
MKVTNISTGGTVSDELDILRVALVGLSLLASVVHLIFVSSPPSAIRSALKTSAIGLLAFVPLTFTGAPGANFPVLWTLAAALALSAVGDFLLALKDQERFFVPGLSSFLAAHVAFIFAFAHYATLPQGFALVAIGVVLIAATSLLRVLIPHLGGMRVPVIAYFTVIMVMVTAAFSVREASWALGAGASLFALSDSLIAVRKFLQPFPLINESVWITYCAAQFLMTAALLTLVVPGQVM